MKLWKVIGLCVGSSAITAGGILSFDAIYSKGYDDCYRKMTGRPKKPKNVISDKEEKKVFNTKEVVGFIK